MLACALALPGFGAQARVPDLPRRHADVADTTAAALSPADEAFKRAYAALGRKDLPALEAAIASGRPTVLDVPMKNNPTPTTGHWNILDIYSPDRDVSHVATD